MSSKQYDSTVYTKAFIMLFQAVLFSVAASVSFADTTVVDPSQGASFAIGQPGELNAQAVAWPQYGHQTQPQPQMPSQIYRSDGSSAHINYDGGGGYTQYNSDGSSSHFTPTGMGGGVIYNSDGTSTRIN